VNAVCPGYADTDIIRDAVSTIVAKTGRSEADALKTFTGTNPQGRLIDPREVAATILWLVSDMASSVTGQAIAVAGGEIM
jgi:NAD(P)-dependent dehydrogenase (short-subunit alcohol dehydrogenase family)